MTHEKPQQPVCDHCGAATWTPSKVGDAALCAKCYRQVTNGDDVHSPPPEPPVVVRVVEGGVEVRKGRVRGFKTTPVADCPEVDHLEHYDGAIECIDAIISAGYGEGFCRGNAMKYIWRAGKKGDAETDLEKARKYLDFELERLRGAK